MNGVGVWVAPPCDCKSDDWAARGATLAFTGLDAQILSPPPPSLIWHLDLLQVKVRTLRVGQLTLDGWGKDLGSQYTTGHG